MAENPWSTLRRRSHLVLYFDDLPAGTDARIDGNDVVLDAALDRVQRRCALMHELVHDERQVGYPHATPRTMQREEATVRRETARRLVPPEELAAWIGRRAEFDPIDARLVSIEFDVTEAVAEEALWVLFRRGSST